MRGIGSGTTSLVLPNILIQRAGGEHVSGGAGIVLQMVPGTEVLTEFSFHSLHFRALCISGPSAFPRRRRTACIMALRR
ncbi:hypothetical protein BDW75DRAFT_202423 [Aspergillus navahoensis]